MSLKEEWSTYFLTNSLYNFYHKAINSYKEYFSSCIN